MATVLCLILFTNVLKFTQNTYVEKFDETTLEVQDFTIRVDNLPHQLEYLYDENVFRGILTQHFEQVIKDQMAVEDHGVLEGTLAPPISNLPQPRDFEVADVCFAKTELKDVYKL